MSKKLYDKNFNILVLGQIISLFGSSIQRFALSLYLLDLTGSASVFATILAISMIPVVLISPIAGMLADRGDKKKLMVLLDVLSAVLLMAYAGVVFNSNDHVFIIATVMVLLSTISTIYQPVVSTCIPVIVADENLVRANAIIQQVSSLSNFLGRSLMFPPSGTIEIICFVFSVCLVISLFVIFSLFFLINF